MYVRTRQFARVAEGGGLSSASARCVASNPTAAIQVYTCTSRQTSRRVNETASSAPIYVHLVLRSTIPRPHCGPSTPRPTRQTLLRGASSFLCGPRESVRRCAQVPKEFGASNEPVTASDTTKHAIVHKCGAAMHDKHNLRSKACATWGQVRVFGRISNHTSSDCARYARPQPRLASGAWLAPTAWLAPPSISVHRRSAVGPWCQRASQFQGDCTDREFGCALLAEVDPKLTLRQLSTSRPSPTPRPRLEGSP